MKPALVALSGCLAMAGSAQAASLVVADTSSDLPGFALTMATLLVNGGLPLTKTGDQSYTVTARQVYCESRSNDALDSSDPRAALPIEQCRMDVQNPGVFDANNGKPFADTHALMELLWTAQRAAVGKNIRLGDCAMGGYCGLFAQAISCRVNIATELGAGGRWFCTLSDKY